MRPSVITVPGLNDVLRIPYTDTPQSKRDRYQRLLAQQAGDPTPTAILRIAQVMTALDDVEDFLSVSNTLAVPLFRRIPNWGLPLHQVLNRTTSAINLANAVLGSITGGRFSKLTWYRLTGQFLHTPEARVIREPTAPILWRTLNPLAFTLQLGQVLHSLTGWGLTLGAIYSAITSAIWAGIDLLTSGRPILVIMPPPTDPLHKAYRLLQQIPYLAQALPALDTAERLATLAAWTGAIHVVSYPPITPPDHIIWPDVTYTTVHYDPHRDVVVTRTTQTATPFVDTMTYLRDEGLARPDDDRFTHPTLPIHLPYDPLTQMTIDPTPYREQWLRARALAAEAWHQRYIDSIREAWAHAREQEEHWFQIRQQREADLALHHHLRSACLDLATWLNHNTPWLTEFHGWQARLLGLALELDIWPRVPRSEWNYCHCSEPYDPPTILPIDHDPLAQIERWLERARYLYRNPGTPHYWWRVRPDRSIEWFRQPYSHTRRDAALVAASYELWGARFYKLPFDATRFPAWANFLDGGPPRHAVPDDPTEYAALRRKTYPSNAWSHCYEAPAGPQPRCQWRQFPDGTWTTVCPT